MNRPAELQRTAFSTLSMVRHHEKQNQKNSHFCLLCLLFSLRLAHRIDAGNLVHLCRPHRPSTRRARFGLGLRRQRCRRRRYDGCLSIHRYSRRRPWPFLRSYCKHEHRPGHQHNRSLRLGNGKHLRQLSNSSSRQGICADKSRGYDPKPFALGARPVSCALCQKRSSRSVVATRTI